MIVLQGKEYKSIAEAARKHNISYDMLLHRIHKYGKDYDNLFASKLSRNKIILLGKEYKSIAEAAKKNNLNYDKLRHCISKYGENNANLFKLAKDNKKRCDNTRTISHPNAHVIKYNGIEYHSLTAFAHAFNIDERLIQNRYERGIHDPTELLKAKGSFLGKPVTINNKTYTSISAMARALATDSISSRTIMNRYHRGIRDINQLIKPIDASHKKAYSLKIKINYHGKTYYSLASLAKACGISRHVMQDRYRRSHNIEYLTAPIREPKQVIANVRKQITNYNDYLIHKRNLLTIADVAKATNYKESVISGALSGLTGKYRYNTNLGFDETDIVKLAITKDELEKAISPNLLVKYAFKPSAIQKIKNKTTELTKTNLIAIPQLGNNYFFDPKTNSVWSNRRSGIQHGVFQKINRSSQLSLNTPFGIKKISIPLNVIKDLIAYPQITADDLTTRQQIETSYNISDNQWYAIITGDHYEPMHVRYNNKGQQVKGYSPEQLLRINKEITKYLERTKIHRSGYSIIIDNIQYNSVAEASRKLKINRRHLDSIIKYLHKDKYVLSDFTRKSTSGKPVIIDDITYLSHKEAANKLNLSEYIINTRVNKLRKKQYTLKDFQNAPSQSNYCSKRAITIDDVTYVSMAEASRKLNISVSKITDIVKHSNKCSYKLSDFKTKDRPGTKVTIDNVTYNTIREAAKATNIGTAIIQSRIRELNKTTFVNNELQPRNRTILTDKNGNKLLLKDFAKKYNITISCLEQRYSKFGDKFNKLSQPMQIEKQGKEITICGIKYKSVSAAARKHKINTKLLNYRLKHMNYNDPKILQVPNKIKHRRDHAIVILGKEYLSIQDAANKNNIGISCLRHRIKKYGINWSHLFDQPTNRRQN